MELAGMTEVGQSQQQQQHQPQRACPRCYSNNTKFCYFNNYSLSQPRYFCKGCRRYWTHGGTLRSVPVGGSSRKSKRPRAEANAAPLVSTPTSASPVISTNLFPFHGGGGVGGGFLSSLVQRPVLQGRQVEFASFGRQDLVGGWQQSFVGAGGDGNSAPAATGAQFWTLGGSVGSTTSNAEGDGGDHASNTNQWRNFSAVTGGGGDDNN